MTSTSYSVILEKYAERHFVSRFEKKYKGLWEVTWRAMEEEFKRMDALFDTSIAETIVSTANIRICKTEFRIAKSRESRKASGNRCIIAVHKDTTTVHVLLVYNKGDLGGTNETATWKSIIRENYKEYRDLL